MPDVRMPDGKVVRFPDTMSREQIRDMIATKYPEVAKPAAPAAEQAPQSPSSNGFLRGLDDFGRGVADMASFGFADEMAAGANAAIGNGDYASNVAAERARDADGGWSRLGGQVAGAFMLPGKLAASVGGAAFKGALGGAVYGLGSGEGTLQERAPTAGAGALFGGAAGGAVRGIANRFQTRAAERTIPTVADLRKTAEAGYKMADDAMVAVKPEGMRRLGTAVVDDLTDMGYHPSNEKQIGVLLGEIERLGNTSTTYKGLQTFRKMISNVAGSSNPAEAKMAMKIMNRLDDYMRNIPAQDVISGNVAQASKGFRQGQDNWSRMRRADMVDTAQVKAERRAASTGTGGNLENAMRQNVRRILDSPKLSRGMTPSEAAMAEKVVRGTPTQNVLRQIGKLSPTTGGLQGAFTVGATAMNPLFAIPAMAGFGAKAVAEGMTAKNFNRLSQMIRSGGKTGKELVALAKAGQLSIPQIKRVEMLAKLIGMPAGQLMAAVGVLLEKNAVQ